LGKTLAFAFAVRSNSIFNALQQHLKIKNKPPLRNLRKGGFYIMA